LPDFGKKNVALRQNKIQLHCFPDIPVDISGETHDCAPEENSFKRIHFETVGSACSDSAKSLDDQDAAGNPFSTAEIEQQSYEKGFQEGQKAGIASQNQEIESVVKSLHQAILHIQNVRKEIFHTIEHEVVELALAIARKVVCNEVKTNKEVVVCVAKEALRRVEAPGRIKIRLNPADLDFITDTKTQISTLVNQMDNVTFEAEKSVSRGGCMIETDMGDIDARIEKQFQVVADKFQAELFKPEPKGNSSQIP
jgi:flagellar assembly protein FliH